MSKHTPTPWSSGGNVNPAVILPDGSVWTEMRPAKWALESHGEPNTKANADVIVRAVNAHEGLVEALKDLVALYESSPGRDPTFVKKGLSAIAKAEGRTDGGAK